MSKVGYPVSNFFEFLLLLYLLCITVLWLTTRLVHNPVHVVGKGQQPRPRWWGRQKTMAQWQRCSCSLCWAFGTFFSICRVFSVQSIVFGYSKHSTSASFQPAMMPASPSGMKKIGFHDGRTLIVRPETVSSFLTSVFWAIKVSVLILLDLRG